MEVNTIRNRQGLFFIVFYLIAFFFINISGGEVQEGQAEGVMNLRISQIISSTLFFIIPSGLFCRYLRPERNSFLNLDTAPRLMTVGMGLLCMILSFPLADLLSVWNQELVSGGGGAIRDWIQKEASRAERINGVFFSDHSMQGLWMNILVLGGIAAFSEELFFRGLVQETLRKNGLGNWGSVIAAAFIFSAFHLEFNNFLPIFFLGIVLGYLYMLTKNLWVSILGHFFNNTFLLVSLYFDKASNTSTVDDHVSIGWTVGSSVLMILQFYVMRRYVMRFRTQSNK